MANKSKAKKAEEDLNLEETTNVVVAEEVVKVEVVDEGPNEEGVDYIWVEENSKSVSVEEDSIMLCSETANVVIKSGGIFVDGELCNNMNKIYNSIMRFIDEHYFGPADHITEEPA